MASEGPPSKVIKLLQCPVCSDRFSTIKRIPKVIPCGHTFCKVCLEDHIDDDKYFRCPSCRREHEVPVGGVNEFITNFVVSNMIENVCPSCQKYCLPAKCSHCSKEICDDCMTKHLNDYRTNVTGAVEELKGAITKIQPQIEEWLASMKKQGEFCDQAQKQLAGDLSYKEQEAINKTCMSHKQKVVSGCASKAMSIMKDAKSALKTAGFVSRGSDAGISENNQVNGSNSEGGSLGVLATSFNGHPKLYFGDGSGESSEEKQYHAQLQCPWGVTVIPSNGYIVVTDNGSHRVVTYTSRGRYVKSFGGRGTTFGKFKHPRGVTVTPKGDLAITDNHHVQFFTTDGSFIKRLGKRGDRVGEFQYPDGIAYDEAGQLYVYDATHVQVFNKDGAVLRSILLWATENQTDLSMLNGLCVSPINGKTMIFVTDIHKEAVRMFSATSDKQVLQFGRGGEGRGQFNHPADLAISKDNHIIVTDKYNHRVQVFKSDGNFVCRFGREGAQPGEFSEPKGVALTPSGDIVVCDSLNRRIQVF